MEFVIIGLRYILLLILYLFVFRVILLILRDIKGSSGETVPEPDKMIPIPDDAAAAHLVVVKSDVPALNEGARIMLAEENYIGRGPENRIQILDNFTSHNHARLALHKGQYWLEDLNSKNGTYVDGVRIEKPVALINGDLFQIGGVIFRFER